MENFERVRIPAKIIYQTVRYFEFKTFVPLKGDKDFLRVQLFYPQKSTEKFSRIFFWVTEKLNVSPIFGSNDRQNVRKLGNVRFNRADRIIQIIGITIFQPINFSLRWWAARPLENTVNKLFRRFIKHWSAFHEWIVDARDKKVLRNCREINGMFNASNLQFILLTLCDPLSRRHEKSLYIINKSPGAGDKPSTHPSLVDLRSPCKPFLRHGLNPFLPAAIFSSQKEITPRSKRNILCGLSSHSAPMFRGMFEIFRILIEFQPESFDFSLTMALCTRGERPLENVFHVVCGILRILPERSIPPLPTILNIYRFASRRKAFEETKKIWRSRGKEECVYLVSESVCISQSRYIVSRFLIFILREESSFELWRKIQYWWINKVSLMNFYAYV